MSNRLRVIQFLNNILNERQGETNIRAFSARQNVTNLRTFATGTAYSVSVQALDPGSITIQGKGAVTYQIQNPIALVPVMQNVNTTIAYHDFSHIDPYRQSVTSQIKTVETQLFSPYFWQTYLQRLKSGLSANFQTLEVDRGVILKDPNNRPILLPSFVYVEIVKGPSFFKSAETVARTGEIREGGGTYTVTMFPANFAQLARLAFTNTAIKEGETTYLLSPLAVFEEALRRATKAIGDVAQAGGGDVEKRNFAGALMPGTQESLEVARAVALAALAKALRENAGKFKIVQFQIRPDAQGRLSQEDLKKFVDNLSTVYGMVAGAVGSAVSTFNDWANGSIQSAQWEALQGLSGNAPDVWSAARVSQPADITVSTNYDGSWTVTAKDSLKSATMNAKFRPVPALVEGSSLIRAREGGGGVFTTIADTLLDSMNAIGHNWDLVPRVLAAFNEKWGVWTQLPSFFDASGKLRPLSEVMSDLARGLIQKRAMLEKTPKLEEFQSEVAILLHYIDTLYGENPNLLALQSMDQDINRLSELSTFQLDPIVRSALDTMRSTINLSGLVRYIPTLETMPSIPTTPWELPVIGEQTESEAGTAGLELTPQ
jgi:hypothetical protein